MKVSIIIVHYRARAELFDCLRSINQNIPKLRLEIIVVDNDEKAVIGDELMKEFPYVRYIKSKHNKGFGAGNNLGARKAKGEYLFFLNPDTLIFPDTIQELVKFFEKKEKIGIVAPVLFHKNKKAFELQGASELTPLRAVVALSFINKLFPNNAISKKYFNLEWNKTTVKEVDTVPGTAFMIKKKIFYKIGGFDENFFLYFEEFDLCKRVRENGYKIFITPSSKIIHLWERSTKYAKNIDKIFRTSRMYYFKKHFGIISVVLVEIFCRTSKKVVALSCLILLLTVLSL